MSPRLLSSSIACLALAAGGVASGARGEPAFFERTAIFPANSKDNHASCVVELKDGSLLAAWYAGSGERTADDVVLEGSRLAKGKTTWGPRFLMADTPGYPDCNPALFAAPDGSLWLFWPTDQGTSSKWTRHVERGEPGKGQFHYPSISHAVDGSINVTYRDSRPGRGGAIAHGRFNEAWIKAGDND